MLNGPNQPPFGVVPEPKNPDEDREQKPSEQSLSSAAAPEEKPNS